MTDLIQKFKDWILSDRDFLAANGLSYKVVESPPDADTRSIRLDFEDEKYISTLVVWETGACFLDSLSVDSEETVCSEHFSIGDNDDSTNIFRTRIKGL
jgi:hypothetical protein